MTNGLDAHQFLDAMFGDAVDAQHRLTIVSFDRAGHVGWQRFSAIDPALAWAAQRDADGYNVYFNLGLLRGEPPARGCAQDVGVIGALWADVDIAHSVHRNPHLPCTLDDALSLIGAMPARPSMVVDSGHGLHAYWLLTEPWVLADDEQRQRAADLERSWHNLLCDLGSDRGWKLENCGDLARILRLPGTHNWKEHDRPVSVRVIESDPQRRYDVEQLHSLLPDEVLTAAATVGTGDLGALVLRPDAAPPLDLFAQAIAESPKFAATWRRQRDDLADPSPSGHDLALATIATIRGWSDQQVAELLIAYRREHNEQPAKALRADYLHRTLRQARQTAGAQCRVDPQVNLDALTAKAAQATPSRKKTPPPEASAELDHRAVLTRLADVQPQPVRWLWPQRIAIGKLTLIAGDPGLGKSFLTLDMAARVSTGVGWPDLPGQSFELGGVVLLSAEDDLADTVRPRLDAAGADVSRIVALEAVRHRDPETGAELREPFSLAADLPVLEQAIESMAHCRLVVIDPVSAYLGNTDSHRNAEVRALLAPLGELAGRHGVAVVAVTHLRKGEGAAIYRAMGSLAFIAAARAAWAVTRDKDDPTGDRRLFLPVKNNLGNDQTGLAFTVDNAFMPTTMANVHWEPEPVLVTADAALSDRSASSGGRSRQPSPEQVRTAEWLREELAGGAVTATNLRAAANQAGYTWADVRWAKGNIGAVSRREGFGPGGTWWWSMDGSIGAQAA